MGCFRTKSWHVTSDQKGDKSQTKRRARGKSEDGGNLASSRAEVRELDRPLTEPLLTQRTPVHPVFGIISRRHSVCIGESIHVPQGNWEKSEPVPCKEGPQLFPVEVKNRMAMSCLAYSVSSELANSHLSFTTLLPWDFSLSIWVVTLVWLPHSPSFSLFQVILPSSVSLSIHPAKLSFPYGYFSLCSQHPVQCNGPIQARFLDWMIRFL